MAASLRLYKLGKQSLFVDEAFSWLNSQFPFFDLFGILNNLNHTPFYFFILKFYLFFVPQTEFWMRSLSVIFSLFSLLAAMLIMRCWWGRRASLFTAWLIAISSFEIYYAQDVRMYTMMGFLWLVSCGLLLEIIKGRPKFLIPWGINLVLISQTHIYGLVLAFVQSALIAVLWMSGFYFQKIEKLPRPNEEFQSSWTWRGVSGRIWEQGKWVFASGVIVAFGTLPIVLTLMQSTAWRSLGGGVWIPALIDLPRLYLLASIGLSAGHNFFLDGIHLVLPSLSTIPTWLWLFIGLLVPGSLAVLGSLQAWKTGDKQRWFVLVTFASTVGPILVVWLIGWFLQTNTWAYKSFLGVVLLFYMLAGVGFSAIKLPWVRRALILLTFGISMLSLIPYYTVWHKDYSREAFLSLPNADESGIVLLERAYLSPLAHFYLGKDQQVIALNNRNDLGYPFLDAEFGPKFLYGYDALACDELDFSDFKNVWIYGSKQVFKEHLREMPNCFGDAHLWIYHEMEWELFDS